MACSGSRVEFLDVKEIAGIPEFGYGSGYG